MNHAAALRHQKGYQLRSGTMTTKTMLLASALIIGTTSLAVAQDAPKFYADTYPEYALPSALAARGVLEGDQATLDAKTRELIALGVAAQIPCSYCVYAHTRKAQARGASEAEIREAVATAATVRQWSTVLNGMQYDLDEFKAEFDKLVPPTN
jgi:AhpD family alkylhydroperoxidase